MAAQTRNRSWVHTFFDLSVVAKGIDGVLETAGGILLFFVKPAEIKHLLRIFTIHELQQDPHDMFAHYLIEAARHLRLDTQLFAAAYLFGHGVVKIGLVVALLQKRLWAYPTAMIAFLLFLAYQLYRYTYTGSKWMIVLSVLDVFVIVLTWFEYQRLRKPLPRNARA